MLVNTVLCHPYPSCYFSSSLSRSWPFYQSLAFENTSREASIGGGIPAPHERLCVPGHATYLPCALEPCVKWRSWYLARWVVRMNELIVTVLLGSA